MRLLRSFRTSSHVWHSRIVAWGFKSGGKDFVLGFDPRRHMDGPRNQDSRRRRTDLFNHLVRTSPAVVLDVLVRRGLAEELLIRLAEVRRRYPHSKRWEKRPKSWRQAIDAELARMRKPPKACSK